MTIASASPWQSTRTGKKIFTLLRRDRCSGCLRLDTAVVGSFVFVALNVCECVLGVCAHVFDARVSWLEWIEVMVHVGGYICPVHDSKTTCIHGGKSLRTMRVPCLS